MIFTIPQSLETEHKGLHVELKRIIDSGGAIGDAAKAVAKPLHKHFTEEEEFAMPPLGLLASLAAGVVTEDMLPVVTFTQLVKERFAVLLREHKAIITALDKLSEVAKHEKREDVAVFAERLKVHARMEEEILYPAAILVGEFLKLKLGEPVDTLALERN
jgi:hypothetical protein